MGKRKTRKRTHRSKKGGYMAKAGNEVCIWTNDGARGKTEKEKKKRCPTGVKKDAAIAQTIYPIGLDPGSWTRGPSHDKDVNYPLSKLTNYVAGMELDIVDNDNIDNLINDLTDIYIVIHERHSRKIGGPRYGLYVHPECTISKNNSGAYAYTLDNPLWNDDLHFNIDATTNVVSGMWGKTVANNVGTLMFENLRERRTSYGGKRRRRTKKKRRRRRKRKGTKKKRRRRRR